MRRITRITVVVSIVQVHLVATLRCPPILTKIKLMQQNGILNIVNPKHDKTISKELSRFLSTNGFHNLSKRWQNCFRETC